MRSDGASPPRPPSVPVLRVPASSTPDTAASLASAALKHLLFARGQTSQTVASLELTQKRRVDCEQELRQISDNGRPPRQLRRSKPDQKREQFLESIQRLEHALLAATRCSASYAELPILVVFGTSPLSPLEAYHITMRLPPGSSATSLEACSIELSSAPVKLRPATERKLVQFLISTEELQDAFSKPLRATRMHIFTQRKADWACAGWKIRRGFGLKLEHLVVPPADIARPVEQPDSESSPPADCVVRTGSTPGPHKGRLVPQTQRNEPVFSQGDDLNALSECLSPLKKRVGQPSVGPNSRPTHALSSQTGHNVQRSATSRPALGSLRTSSFTSSGLALASSGTALPPLAALATPAKRLGPAPKRLAVWASPATPRPRPALFSLPQKVAKPMGSRWQSVTHNQGKGSGSCSDDDDDDDEDDEDDDDAPVLRPGIAPIPSNGVTCNPLPRQTAPGVVADERPRGSRLFPPSSDPAKSLLLRNRKLKSPREREASASETSSLASSQGRPRRKVKGAAFSLDCSGDDFEMVAPASSRVPASGADERVCWFQCEVSVKHL
ncbi:unnamed protein product [Parajaminaea phylloscopi]